MSEQTWHLGNIPKTAHFYWGAKKLSFLRYMSLYSFRKYNPDWVIKLHVPHQLNPTIGWEYKQYENQDRDFLDYTSMLDRCNVQVCEMNCSILGVGNHINEVHKSDFLRYYLLCTEGGLYSDMDILFFRSMNALSVNKPTNPPFNSFGYWGEQSGEISGHAIGFLMGEHGNAFYRDVFAAAKRHFRQSDYQTIGADLLNTRFSIEAVRHRYPRMGFFDKQAVYAIDHNRREYLYERDGRSMLGPTAVGIHWYGGSQYVSDLLFNVNHENYREFPNQGTVMKMLRECFPEGI